ncbi:thiol reductant ABC exporter CydD subunit [Saccharothrix tamanrassetensis]|uniref:Thiol reductant ABC exporter CydD subunit n=1 Tax=Saccharothrix tamanrassetensis TaxID=1051531 RepID=A0A841CCE0_9PSEU|nr:thiol reductant ABC exporter subunit CydD [Saccharothrix tamanrassetensis]MBB5956192.1 thiol reductant ABC exporter CydD subunit [Saccharothrix tamanrassetensis]
MRHVDRRYVVTLTLLATATAILVLAQAELLASVLSTGAGLVLLIATIAARALLVWAGRVVTQREAASVKADLRKHLLRNSSGPTGELTTLVVKGLDAIEPYLAGYLPQLVVSVAVPLAVLARLSFADWGSALTIALTLPLIPVFAALVGMHTRDRTRRQWSAMAAVGGHFLDVVQGLSTLRLFGRAEAQARTVRAMAAAHADETIRTLRVAFLSALVLELVATLSVALVAVPVGLRLLHGGVTLQVALLVLLLAPEAYLPLRAAGAQFHASAEGLAVLEQAMKTTRPKPLAIQRRSPDLRRSSITFDHVEIHYPNRAEPALTDFNLQVAPGERVALIGPSGAGKSSLLAALLGEVHPSSGRILIADTDLRELDRTEWLRQLAWVPQRPTLFPGTVAENIALGAPEANVQAAAQAVGLNDLVDTDHPLSSGERQRVAVARAIARDSARMLLLDEPTSRLDNRTEETVLRATREWTRGRTALVVAHRPALLTEVDRVVELR